MQTISMLKVPTNSKSKTYSERPKTPLGEDTGLTSTTVSQQPSRKSTPPGVNPYQYQPAITWTHPGVYPGKTSNYAEAILAQELAGLSSTSELVVNGTTEVRKEDSKEEESREK